MLLLLGTPAAARRVAPASLRGDWDGASPHGLALSLAPAPPKRQMRRGHRPRGRPHRRLHRSVRDLITPAQGRPYRPVRGSWEGSADGTPISFQLVYHPSYTRFHMAPYAYEDLTILNQGADSYLPGCPIAYGFETTEVISEGTPAGLISTAGIFSARYFAAHGGLTGPRSALFTAKEKSAPIGPYRQACARTLTWHLHPAYRRTVADGTWELRFANGESERFTVSAGGRLALKVGFPAMAKGCGAPFSQLDLFIEGDRNATFADPQDGIGVRMDFGAEGSATGQMTFGSSAACAVAFTASLWERAH